MTPSFTPYLLLMVDCSWFTGLLLSILRTLYIRIGSIRLKTAKRVGMLVSAEADTEEVRLAKKTHPIDIQYTIYNNIQYTYKHTYIHTCTETTNRCTKFKITCMCM
jgi:hypothetical protein